MTKNQRTMSLAAVLLLASLTFTWGCGQPAQPPAGAPNQADSPTVDDGKESAPASDESEEAMSEAAGDESAEAGGGESEAKTAAADDAAAGGPQWGTLTGRIVYDGTPPKPQVIDTSKDPNCKEQLTTENLVVSDSGGLKNAVIMLRTKDVPVNPEYDSTADAKIDLTNKNCRFEPHVQVVRLSQEVLLKNDDPTGHNTNVTTFKNTNINPILAVGSDPIPYKFTSEESVPVKVSCNIHPWMGAWLVPRTDPYAAVTDEDGNFTIKDLPAGKELEFRLWQESAGYLKNATFKGGKADSRGGFKLKIKPGENSLGEIKVSSSIFK